MPLGFFPLVLRPLQIIRPIADSSDGNWTDQSGGTSLFAAIDEVAADDGDYIRSSTLPQNDICKIKLGVPANPPIEPVVIAYRYWHQGGRTDLLVRLMQATTQIAQWSHTDISNEAPVQAQQTLTTEQFNSITDFSDLYLEFEADSP